MARPKKVVKQPSVEPVNVEPGNDEPVKDNFCKFCKLVHEKSFDGVGVNHDRFAVGSKADVMFKSLCEQPLLPLFIPYEFGEKTGAVASPCLNGLRINILKGRYVQVPKQVAEVMMESLNQTAQITDTLKVMNPFTGESKPAKLENRSESDKKVLNA